MNSTEISQQKAVKGNFTIRQIRVERINCDKDIDKRPENYNTNAYDFTCYPDFLRAIWHRQY